jgi:hypothetical protein
MIIPSKHIKFSQSLLGLSGLLLSLLIKPLTVDELWNKYNKVSKKRFPAYHDFDNFILSINLLYSIEAIELNKDDKIYIL